MEIQFNLRGKINSERKAERKRLMNTSSAKTFQESPSEEQLFFLRETSRKASPDEKASLSSENSVVRRYAPIIQQKLGQTGEKNVRFFTDFIRGIFRRAPWRLSEENVKRHADIFLDLWRRNPELATKVLDRARCNEWMELYVLEEEKPQFKEREKPVKEMSPEEKEEYLKSLSKKVY